MFLTPMNAPGIHIERVLNTSDRFMAGGHAVVRLDGLRVPESAVLRRVGAGFRYAQVRLAPARLTHWMRWLGAAWRAHDIAADYARRRTAFGKPIGKHKGIGFMLADNEMDIHLSRLVIWHPAWVLDQGDRGTYESRMAKVIRSGALSTAACRSWAAGSASPTTRSSRGSSAKCGRSASMTAPPRCIAGTSSGGYCRRERHHDTDRRERAIDPLP